MGEPTILRLHLPQFHFLGQHAARLGNTCKPCVRLSDTRHSGSSGIQMGGIPSNIGLANK